MSLPTSGQLSLKDIQKEIYTFSYTYSSASISNTLNGTTGLTMAVNQTIDDSYIKISLPFYVFFLGRYYNFIYICSNSYATFGGPSTAYNGFTGSYPGYRSIRISAADNSYQRVYSGYTQSNTVYVVRYEGTSSAAGTPGSPNIVWELWFYLNTPGQIDVHIGANARGTGGNYGITDGSSYIAQPLELRQANNSLRITSTISSSTNFSLKSAASGTYGTLSQYYPRPSSTAPYNLNGWHGYNHYAPTSVLYNLFLDSDLNNLYRNMGIILNSNYAQSLTTEYYFLSDTIFENGTQIYNDYYRQYLLPTTSTYVYILNTYNNIYYYTNENGLQLYSTINYGNIYFNSYYVNQNNNLCVNIGVSNSVLHDLTINFYVIWVDAYGNQQINSSFQFIIPAGSTDVTFILPSVDPYGRMDTLNFNKDPGFEPSPNPNGSIIYVYQ